MRYPSSRLSQIIKCLSMGTLQRVSQIQVCLRPPFKQCFYSYLTPLKLSNRIWISINYVIPWDRYPTIPTSLELKNMAFYFRILFRILFRICVTSLTRCNIDEWDPKKGKHEASIQSDPQYNTIITPFANTQYVCVRQWKYRNSRFVSLL